MFRVIASASLVVALSACSTALQAPKSASAEATADPAASADPAEKKICRDVSTTGSYGPRHACHTKAEWEKIDALS